MGKRVPLCSLVPDPNGPRGKPWSMARLMLMMRHSWKRDTFCVLACEHGWYTDGQLAFILGPKDEGLRTRAMGILGGHERAYSQEGMTAPERTARARNHCHFYLEWLANYRKGWGEPPAEEIGTSSVNRIKFRLLGIRCESGIVWVNARDVATVRQRWPRATIHLSLADPLKDPARLVQAGKVVGVTTLIPGDW